VVAQMTGPYRIPDALRLADRLARGLDDPARRTANEESAAPNQLCHAG
jgi:hypothetical protein